MDLNLQGKVALVTGASRGLGYAIAERLIDEGVAVGLCARSQAALETAAASLRRRGGHVMAQCADVCDAGQMHAFVHQAASELGPPSMLVANAGGTVGGRFLESSDDDWQQTLDVNLLHTVRLIREALPFLQRQGGGSIVAVSSISGLRPGSRVQYAAAKAGTNALVQGLAWELAPYGVRINAVLPGSMYFKGGNWADLEQKKPELYASFVQDEFPFGRLGRPDELAAVVAFLLSSQASWIHGALIPVDGGQGWPSVSLRGR
jgi:3-oxoacyl-[acyl-carrier protein] reductase